MRLAIVGSRAFNNYSLLEDEVNKLSGVSEIISGGAIGADTLGARYARLHNLPLKVFLPDWQTFGRKAGYIRNRSIIENSDYVIAFWDGHSSGTRHSISLAKKLNKQLIVIYF